MDISPATTSLNYTNFYAELETDEQFENDDVPEHYEIPSRPESRLGFNAIILDSAPPTEDESRDRFVLRTTDWRRDFGQALGTTHSEDIDMEIIPTADNKLELYNSSFSLSSGSDEDADLEPDSDCSVYEDSDEETETLLLPPPLHSFTPLPFPAPQTIASEWTTGRPKFSCLPSPLSPRHIVARTFSFRHIPYRHSYPQHGYSRHALQHLKWFWATREDDWIDPQDRLRDAKAYGGLSILGIGPSPVRGHAVAPQDVSTQLPPLSIHPRRGDLSALRDPYCMHIDRYFVGLPPWTMAKTLWIFDMHIGMKAQERGETLEPENRCSGVTNLGREEDDSTSEVESLDTSTSLHFSDDSDTTLVESDSDSEHSPTRSRSVTCSDGLPWESAEAQSGEGSSSSCHMFSESPHLEKGSSRGSHKRSRNDKTQHKMQTYPESCAPSPDSSCPPWTTSWYRRWDLLLHLVRHDQDSAAMDVRDDSFSITTAKTPMFFIGDADEEMASAESDEDQDDMEDVLIMVNPLHQAGSRQSFQV